MAPMSAQADAMYRDEVARAKAMNPVDRLLEGPRLFDRACRVMADGIRHRHPQLSAAEVLAKVEAHLARVAAVEHL